MTTGRMELVASPYGPVAPVADHTTGLHLLQLHQGFTYQPFGWAGDLVNDGKPAPMKHEAVALDPATGVVYLTEDDRNQSGLYRFVPNNIDTKLGPLEQGGTLYMTKVLGADKVDL